jgi:hypothetical protein
MLTNLCAVATTATLRFCGRSAEEHASGRGAVDVLGRLDRQPARVLRPCLLMRPW